MNRHTLCVCLLVAAVFATLSARDRDTRITVAPGVQLFVHEEGRGQPVIVLHGGPGLDSNYLAPDFAPLARHHRLVFYDQRGSGRSTLASGVTADVLVADLESLRRALKLDRFALVGHSWGGGLAALYTIAHPDRVSRLVLVDSIPIRRAGTAGFGQRLRDRLTPEENARVADAARRRDAATTDAERVDACRAYWSVFVRAYYGDPALISRSRGDVCAASGAALANGSTVNESVFASLGDYDWTPDVARLTTPTLVVHGALDPIPLDTGREWSKAIPGAELVVLEKSGHMSYVEEPDRFFRVVDDFLAGRPTTRETRP